MKLNKKIKEAFSSRNFKMGGFQSMIMTVVIALVVILNLIVSKLDLSVDLSEDDMYTLSEETRKLAGTLQDEIIIYYLCQKGQETLDTGTKSIDMERIVNQYGKLAHITVEKKDPVQYPAFAKDYTEEQVSNHDIVVVNKTKNTDKYIQADSIIVSEADYTSGSYQYSIDLEGQVTAAIQSLTSGSAKKVYITSGHGEVELGTAFTDMLGKSNYTTDTLDTVSIDRVPEDCDLLLVNAPQYDLTEEEYKTIGSYLKQGGKAMFFLNMQAVETANYDKLLRDYGVHVVKGYVVDTELALRADVPLAFFPNVNSHDITGDVGNARVYMDYSVGLTSQSDERGSLSVESLLDTSEAAYSRTDNKEMDYSERLDTDIKGAFSLAMAVTDTHAEKGDTAASGASTSAVSEETDFSETDTRLVVYSSPDFAMDAVASTNQYGNRSMLLNSLTWLTGEEISNLAIPARSLSQATVSIASDSIVFWTAALVIVLPLILLAAGFIIWFRRRRR